MEPIRAERARFWLVAVVAAVLTAAALFDRAQVDERQDDARGHVVAVIGLQRARIEAYLNARVHVVNSLAAMVRAHPDLSAAEFDVLGRELIAGTAGIRSIQLAPRGVVTHVVPRQGNEISVGHDLMADPERRPAVEAAIAARTTVLAGPYQLRQGGEGLVGRLPIFIADAKDGERFWGLAIIVLDMPHLWADTLTRPEMEGVRLAVRGRDGKGAAGDAFFGAAELDWDQAVRAGIVFGSGTWEVAGLPEGGWPHSWPGRPLLVIASLLLCLAFAALAVRLERQSRRLANAAAAAHRNEQRFRSLFDEAMHLTATLTPEGVVGSANHTLCTLFDRRAEDMVGTRFDQGPWWNGDPVLGERLRAAIAAAGQGRPARFDCNLPRHGGGFMNVDFTVKPLTDAQGRVVELLVEGRDLTARKRTEDLLEARLRLAQLSAGHSLHQLLVATLDEACALTGSCTGFYHFLDDDQKTLALQAWSTATTRDYCRVEGESRHYDVDQAGVWVDAVRQRRAVVYNDYQALTHKGGLPQGHAPVLRFMSVPIIRDGLIKAVIGVGNKPTDYDADDLMVVETLADLAWDLTERKRAEAALLDHGRLIQRRYESLRALSTIAALPPEGTSGPLEQALALGAGHLGLPLGIIARIDGDAYTVMHHHAPAEAGLDDGQVFRLGDTYCALTLAARDVVAIPHMGRSEHAGHPCYQAFKLEAYIGVPLSVRGRPFGTVSFSSPEPYVRDFDDGDLEFVRLLGRWVGSVLEREAAEAEILAAKEAAEQRSRALADSNAELEQFAYVASHDMRQPLRMITSYLGLIERRYGDRLDQDGHDFLNFARDGAVQMDRLICDLLEYSRVGRHGEMDEAVDMAAAAEEACHNLTVLIDETAARVGIDGGPASVAGNRSELVRLFQNLIGNGIKYRAPGREPVVAVRWSRQGDEWLVEIEDNGIGIAPEFREEVFKIFRRLHSSAEYEGTGIGLAVCQKIVRNHGGRIWLDAAPSGGCIFRFALPALAG